MRKGERIGWLMRIVGGYIYIIHIYVCACLSVLYELYRYIDAGGMVTHGREREKL